MWSLTLVLQEDRSQTNLYSSWSRLLFVFIFWSRFQHCYDQYPLTPSSPAVPNCCCSKGLAPRWSNPPFLNFDIRALWRSGLSARAPECQKLTRGSAIAEELRDALRQLKYYGRFLTELLTRSSANPEASCEHIVS